MRSMLAVAVLGLFCGFVPGAHAQDAPSADQVQAWVAQLGHEDFAKRAEAEEKLLQAGPAAEAALEKAALSDDIETKQRAGRLLGKLKTEPLLAKMTESAAKAQSLEADFEMKMSMMGMQTGGAGHFKGKGDSSKFIMDMTMQVMGQEMKMNMVNDGTTVWIETTMPGGQGKMVQKMSGEMMKKLGGQQGGSPMDQVQQMRKTYDFTEVSEDKLGERAVYVLKGKIKANAADEAAKRAEEVGGAQAAAMARAQMQGMDSATIYIDKEDLLVRKLNVLDAQGAAVMEMDMKNMKINVELKEDEFKYTPPEGATVMDVEEMLRKAKEGGGAAPAPDGGF
ncbi:MAG: hypothetical protein M5U26_26910 [Planctomycetota bacterium]|nr:hypothetical protein [Planctomycetota bacterium]